MFDMLTTIEDDFAEAKITLKNNHIIDILSTLKELMVLANLFTDNKSKDPQKTL